MSTHAEIRKITAPDILAAKNERKVACITAYDYCGGVIADQSGADLILVGDSLGMVVLGHEDTLSVTMDEMLHHCRATARGVNRALLVGDMPFMSYHTSIDETVTNAGRFVQEGGTRAVKLEGGVKMAEKIEAVVEASIPVMGHIGLTPQSVAKFGGFKAQGKSADAAKVLLDDAIAVAEAGAFCMVLEAMPVEVAQMITESVDIPTIGIGAGLECDGQILVYHDVLGMFDRFTPKFVRRYAELGEASVDALTRYVEDVKYGRFPTEKNTIHLSEEEQLGLKKLKPRKKKR